LKIKAVVKVFGFIILGIILLIGLLCVIGMIKFNILANLPGFDVDGNKLILPSSK